MNQDGSHNAHGETVRKRTDGGSDVTSARAQFEAAAGPACVPRDRPGHASAEPVFDDLDWTGAVGGTVQAATIHLSGRVDGPREVLEYDLDGTGLLACRDDGPDGDTVALHFVSASSRAAYERALRSVAYANRAIEPQAGERRFDVEVIDATGFPVQLGTRALWVEAAAPEAIAAPEAAAPEPIAAAPTAVEEPAIEPPVPQTPTVEPATEAPAETVADAGFDTLSPEVIRFDLDDHVLDTAVGFDDAAFAARVAEPASPEPAPVAAPPAQAEPAPTETGDRFAALYGDGGYWVRHQSAARAAEAEGEPEKIGPAAAPSIFRESAEIYHIYRPAGATAAPDAAPQAAPPRTSFAPEAPVSFVRGDRTFRVFRHAPEPELAATPPAPRHAPAEADRAALHFADLFEGDVDANGLEEDPGKRGERDFLFGLGRGRAAA